MTREEALFLYKCRAAWTSVDCSMRPIAAGMGRCPWRIIVSVIISHRADKDLAGRVLMTLLFKWGTPELLATSSAWEVRQLCGVLNKGGQRARMVRKMSQRWVKDDWDTVLDLPGLTVEAHNMLKEYSGKYLDRESKDS